MTRPAPEPLVLNLAAARMKGTRPEDEGQESCWADVPTSDSYRACGQPAEHPLGLCASHRWRLISPPMLEPRR